MLNKPTMKEISVRKWDFWATSSLSYNENYTK